MTLGTIVVLGLGSNVDPEHHLPAAVRRLARELRLESVSRVWESPPVGAPGTPRFLNAAVRAVTSLPPAELKREVLRPLEARAGRVRSAERNAPRTLDLDLVLYGSEIVHRPQEGLHLPDPDLGRYAHIAVPVAEAWPEASHPETGEPLADVARRLAAGAELVARADVDLISAWREGNPGAGGA